MNIWEKWNEYENYENNINKRNKIFKYCHKHAPIEELHAITFPIMEFMDVSVYKRISLRPRVRLFASFASSPLEEATSLSCFFPSKELGKKDYQSHKPLQSQVDVMFFKLSHIFSKDII